MTDQVAYESIDKVAVITIRRPAQRNALNEEVVEALRDAWSRFEASEDRCAILAGEGASFCAGVDLNSPVTDVSPAVPGMRIPLTKPVIAAVSGHCVGAGYVFVQQCDLAVATEDSVFRYPEAKLGLFGGLGLTGTSRIPHKFAMEMMLLGSPLPAERAHEIGLVNAVVENDTHLEAAMSWAQTIRHSAPLVVRAMKTLSDDQMGNSAIATHIRVKEVLEEIAGSQDRVRGLEAARKKEVPEFTGD